MKSYLALAMFGIAYAAPGIAADAAPASPYDWNPRCTERTVDSNSPECVLHREGDPRQTYPAGKDTPSPPPTTKPPAAPTPAKATPQAPRSAGASSR
jgi:hypothetical protein